MLNTMKWSRAPPCPINLRCQLSVFGVQNKPYNLNSLNTKFTISSLGSIKYFWSCSPSLCQCWPAFYHPGSSVCQEPQLWAWRSGRWKAFRYILLPGGERMMREKRSQNKDPTQVCSVLLPDMLIIFLQWNHEVIIPSPAEHQILQMVIKRSPVWQNKLIKKSLRCKQYPKSKHEQAWANK